MLIVFTIVSLIIAVLIFLMFLILKKTVGIVNAQTKSYFVNKLEAYDDLIQDKENKLLEIDNLIKDKEKGIKEENKEKENNLNYVFDSAVIDLFNDARYQDKSIIELNRKIDENFVVNYEELIKDFLVLCDDKSDYDFCINLREKFDSDTIYKLKSMLLSEREIELSNMLDKKEYRVYETFKLVTSDNTMENFIDYLDQLILLNNPEVLILVGNKSENYDHLGEYVKTVFNDRIYRGIKIVYKDKVYDFSLSERNV